MKGMIVICLILIFLNSQACSTQVANIQVLTPNNQETNQSKKSQEANQNMIKTGTWQEQQVVESDKTSINNAKGLITLSNKYGKKDFVRIYNEDGSLWHEFTYYYDDSDGKFEYENENFEPFAFHPDYFKLALKCVGEDKSRYEVIVNEETGLRKFVKKDDLILKFETWEDHVKGVFAVSFNWEENPLREAPEGKIKVNRLSKGVTFHPVKIEGDWLKVRWDEANKAKNDVGYGWVKWKENNKILVELFYFS